MTNGKISAFKLEVKSELIANILPFWSTIMFDSKNGGFYGRVDGYGNIYPDADKGCVLNSRILWTFSSAYRILKNPDYLEMATRAKHYILNNFFDKQYGGVYWLIDHKGEVVDGKKQIYAQAFTIYALSEYFRSTKDEESLRKAIELYRLIELHSFDEKLGGYFEAFSREWKEMGDLRLSEKDANEKKTMNTHLHVLEAYTNLYRVWKDDGLKIQLHNLIIVFIDKIVNNKSHHLGLFFEENWTDKTDLVSYGHDIEASWLLYEAACVLGNNELIEKIKPICLKIADAAAEGLVPDGGMIYEKFLSNAHVDTDRHWWVQSEAVVGYVNAYELSGDKVYLNKGMAAWRFIAEHLIDKKNKEWYWSVNKELKPNVKNDKAGLWKCPYHNSRMCFEIIERSI
jgi:mannobiose 2-epimerase